MFKKYKPFKKKKALMEIEQESLKSLRSAAAENYHACKQEESHKPGPFSSAETPSKKTNKSLV